MGLKDPRDYSSTFLSPIKSNELNNIKQGQTVPVKLKLTDELGHDATDVEIKLYVTEVSDDGTLGSKEEAKSNGKANIGNFFRSAGNGKYIFNWNTKSLAKGIYQLSVEVNNYNLDTVQIDLR